MSVEWDAVHEAIENARQADRLWRAASEVRVARLKQAAELEAAGRQAEAAGILDSIRAEQTTLAG